jgi:integrase
MDEQAVILAHLAGQGRNLIQFALWTGSRTSELVALDWGDVNFIRGVVVVSRAMTQQSAIAEVPKTDAGNREVKLLAAALEALDARKNISGLQALNVPTRRPTLGGMATSRSGKHCGRTR